MGRHPDGWTCDHCGCGKDKYGKLYVEGRLILCYPCLENKNGTCKKCDVIRESDGRCIICDKKEAAGA